MSLDLVRALAAMAVLLDHWRNIFFVDFGQVASNRWLWVIPYILTSAGHQAVVVFFVLSGYLVGGSTVRAMDNGRWGWRSYLLHRGVRLWVVVVPGMLLCALFDEIGLRCKLAPNLYGGLSGNHMIGNVAVTHTPAIFWGNIFFLQTIFVSTFGSDGALWSLANEFWYYLLFPLSMVVAISAFRGKRGFVAGCLACGMIVVLLVYGPSILLYFPIWMAGAILATVPAKPLRPTIRMTAWIGYSLVFLLSARLDAVNLVFRDYVLALATVAFLWVILSDRRRFAASALSTSIRTTARFSFTLYVVHTPFLVLLEAFAITRWQPSLETAGFGLCTLSATIVLAYLIASATEFNTEKIRTWMECHV